MPTSHFLVFLLFLVHYCVGIDKIKCTEPSNTNFFFFSAFDATIKMPSHHFSCHIILSRSQQPCDLEAQYLAYKPLCTSSTTLQKVFSIYSITFRNIQPQSLLYFGILRSSILCDNYTKKVSLPKNYNT